MTIGREISSNTPALVVRTQGADRSLEAGPSYSIGRNPESDIVVTEARESWRHAVLRLEGSTWLLEDVGSTNGTFLGSQRVQRVEITDDCVLRLGHPDDGQRLWGSVAGPPRSDTGMASPMRDLDPPTDFVSPAGGGLPASAVPQAQPASPPPARPAPPPSPPAQPPTGAPPYRPAADPRHQPGAAPPYQPPPARAPPPPPTPAGPPQPSPPWRAQAFKPGRGPAFPARRGPAVPAGRGP